jgi:hypothetical protein
MSRTSSLFLSAFLLFAPALAAAQDDRITFYGFLDVQVEATSLAGGPAWSFHQHHMNLVTIYQLDERWRVFTEVEYEHGPALEGGKGTGEILLERAVLEYMVSDALEVRIGKFLSPFGLYTELHDASPSILSTSLPSSIYSSSRVNELGETQDLFAKFATGVQVRGTLGRAGWEGDYALYVSNGRGDAPAQQDDNNNKGIGARLAIRLPGGHVQLGASFYDERNGLVADTRQQSLGLDAILRFRGVLIESEALIPRLEKIDLLGAPSGAFRTARGYYVQVSRPVTSMITPFARFEAFDNDISIAGDRETDIVAGVNIGLTRMIFLKNEIQFRRFQDPTSRSQQLYLGSIAVAF